MRTRTLTNLCTSNKQVLSLIHLSLMLLPFLNLVHIIIKSSLFFKSSLPTNPTSTIRASEQYLPSLCHAFDILELYLQTITSYFTFKFRIAAFLCSLCVTQSLYTASKCSHPLVVIHLFSLIIILTAL
jgi:hypothetical protein